LFRGFLLGSLRSCGGRLVAIVASALIFAVFHFFVFKFVVTATLGIVLGYLCWQSRSIWPGVIAHFLHNGLQAVTVLAPRWPTWIGVPEMNDEATAWAHLPIHILVVGGVVFVIGVRMFRDRGGWAGKTPIVAAAEGA
jgi:membrane protease YdiL (CAAX protease family)